jgi:integrase
MHFATPLQKVLMTEARKHAILFAATLLSARKIIEIIDNDDPQNMGRKFWMTGLWTRRLSRHRVKENPARKIRRVPEDNNRVRYLSTEEEKRIREAIRSKPEWAEHEPELDLALHTGLRRTDMYQRLVWESVDLSLRVATIPRSKNDEPVHMPLNSSAMCALAAFRSRGDGSGRVVRNASGKTLNVNAHWFPEILRAAKIVNFRWHDLRHTFASRLRQSGAPLGHIAELMGHKGLSMTRRYAHLSIANLHEAVSRISTDTPIAPEPIAQTLTVSYLQ